jgi:hypothetical protein
MRWVLNELTVYRDHPAAQATADPR